MEKTTTESDKGEQSPKTGPEMEPLGPDPARQG